MKYLLLEIMKKTAKESYPYNVITTEIRLQRILQNKTLARLAFESNVSISYVSRVEQQKLKPNRIFLNDACKSLNISKDALSKLEELEDILNLSIEALIYNDSKPIKEKIKGYNFENFRFRLIKFIIAVIDNKLDEAYELSKGLDKTVSSMNDNDLYSYTISYAIYEFKRGKYNTSKELLSQLEVISNLKIEFEIIINLYLFYISYFLNDANCYRLYPIAFNSIIKSRYLFLLENLYYVYSIFLIHHEDYKEFDKISLLIQSKELKNNLNCYIKILYKKPLKEEDIINACDFVKVCYYKKYDKQKALEIINNHELFDSEFDFSYLVARYLMLEDFNEKYEFILKYASKTQEFEQMAYLKNYFMKEYAYLSKVAGRYKNFNELYLEVFNDKEA